MLNRFNDGGAGSGVSPSVAATLSRSRAEQKFSLKGKVFAYVSDKYLHNKLY